MTDRAHLMLEVLTVLAQAFTSCLTVQRLVASQVSATYCHTAALEKSTACKHQVDHIEKRKPPSDAVSAELSAIMQMLSDAEDIPSI
eukprot:6459913-Amphidinium_carterae.1